MIQILCQEVLLTISNLRIAYNNKEKYVYSGYGITFDSAGSWSFGNDFARNVIIFGVDNSQSSHADNHKNIFIVQGEGPTYGINPIQYGERGGPKSSPLPVFPV